MTFTTKVCRDTSLATLEKKNAAKEQGEFLNYTEAVVVNSTLFDHTHLVTPADTSFYSTRLTGKGTADSIGLAKSLSVMPGDTLNIEVYAKYLDPTSSNWTPALASFIASIASGGGAPAGTIIDGGYPGSLGNNAFPFAGMMNYAHADNSVPKAYLNYLIFDRNYVYRDGGFRQVSSAAKEDGQDVAHEHLYFSNITIKEPGYVYIWLSNENATPVEVFFDDLKVTHGKSAVVQEDDYYPFGLTFNEYERENSSPNKYLYNGKELQTDLGLNWEDYGARMNMPDIGRWNSIDPKGDKYAFASPYNYALNNPIKFVDPDGKDVIILIAKEGAGGRGHMAAIVQDGNGNWHYLSQGTDAEVGASKYVSGVQGGVVLIPLGTKDKDEALKLANTMNRDPYTGHILLKTSSEMDAKIFGAAQEEKEKTDSGELKYKLITNNCVDACQDPISKGTGVKLPKDIDPRPNQYFKKLAKNQERVQNMINKAIDKFNKKEEKKAKKKKESE